MLKRVGLVFAVALLSSPSWGAGAPLSGQPNATSVLSTDKFFDVQTPGVGPVQASAAQIAAYTLGLVTGDCTITAGAITCSKSGGTSFGTFAFQNYTTPPAIGGGTPNSGAFTTLSASGAVSGAGFTSLLASPPAIGGTAAAGGAFTTLAASGAVSGTGFTSLFASPPGIGGTAAAAGAFTTLSASTSMTLGAITGSAQCLHVNTSGLVSGTGSDCGSGGGGTSPGGTSGQIEYNNSGVFGGFTVSGDGTLNTGTGALSVTKTGGVAFATSATTDTTSASNISSGTLAAARGGAGTISGALKGSGSGVVSQAACADLSNGAASCSTDTTNASNISSGTLATARLPATALATGTSVSLTAPRQYYVCTGACTVTPPVPAAGYEFCILNGDNVATVITLAALGSSAHYENTARTAYGTAGTGTLVSGGAAADKVCIVGLDSTHYITASYNGTWTAN